MKLGYIFKFLVKPISDGIELVMKAMNSIVAKGLLFTLRKAREHLYFKARKVMSYFSPDHLFHLLIIKKNSREKNPKRRFTGIYKHNLWGNSESFSGNGSTLSYTKNIRTKLPLIFQKYNIKSVLDAPCGDFNWMKEVLKVWPNIQYIGGDVVSPLIERNSLSYANERTSFEVIDITKDKLPASDLMIVRDCLFHFSYSDLSLFLQNLSRSKIKYLLTSTYVLKDHHRNSNIMTGDFREIDVFAEPICFPKPPIESIDDWIPPFLPRQMCMFEVEALPKRIKLLQ